MSSSAYSRLLVIILGAHDRYQGEIARDIFSVEILGEFFCYDFSRHANIRGKVSTVPVSSNFGA